MEGDVGSRSKLSPRSRERYSPGTTAKSTMPPTSSVPDGRRTNDVKLPLTTTGLVAVAPPSVVSAIACSLAPLNRSSTRSRILGVDGDDAQQPFAQRRLEVA